MGVFPLQCGLRLKNGDSWSFYFSSDLIPWGKEFVKIVGLKEDTQNHKYQMFFYSGQEEYLQNLIYDRFMHNGNIKAEYISYNFLGLLILHIPSTRIYHCILPEKDEQNPNMRFYGMISALFPIYLEIMNSGGLVLHAALLHHPDIEGVAILGPSGEGKSSCASRVPKPWSAYCDDLLLVVREKPARYYIHPLPTWSNFINSRSPAPIWPVELSTALHGLFFLQKAEINTVIPIPKLDSVQWIYESSMQINRQFIHLMSPAEQLKIKNMIFSNACQLSKECQSYILKATLHGCFWLEIEKIMGVNKSPSKSVI